MNLRKLSQIEALLKAGVRVPPCAIKAAVRGGLKVWLVAGGDGHGGNVVACSRECADDHAGAFGVRVVECLGDVDEDDPEGMECDCCGGEG